MYIECKTKKELFLKICFSFLELNISDSVGLDPGGENIEPESKSSKLNSGLETIEALPTPSKLVSGFDGIEALPTPSKLLSDFGNHFDSSGSFSQDSYVEQGVKFIINRKKSLKGVLENYLDFTGVK